MIIKKKFLNQLLFLTKKMIIYLKKRQENNIIYYIGIFGQVDSWNYQQNIIKYFLLAIYLYQKKVYNLQIVEDKCFLSIF